MKYEAVFGNQELFDGAGTFTGLDVVTRSIASGDMMYCRLSDLTQQSLREYPVIAMRRIIQEPKHWTVEDQKAGRLPEVGCMVMVTSVDECASVAAINNDAVCVVYHDGEFTTLHKSGISPIETPEEKAGRLEDEFFFALKDEWQNPKSPPISSASFEVGVRAAYRKLKGGE